VHVLSCLGECLELVTVQFGVLFATCLYIPLTVTLPALGGPGAGLLPAPERHTGGLAFGGAGRRYLVVWFQRACAVCGAGKRLLLQRFCEGVHV
jgi:hypothetical protein